MFVSCRVEPTNRQPVLPMTERASRSIVAKIAITICTSYTWRPASLQATQFVFFVPAVDECDMCALLLVLNDCRISSIKYAESPDQT